jgi:hypothetical protein
MMLLKIHSLQLPHLPLLSNQMSLNKLSLTFPSSLCSHPHTTSKPFKYPMPLSFLSNSKSFLFFLLHSKFPFPMATLTTTTTTTATATPTRARLKGVVFDMDGTLTVPVIDFAAMYKAVLGDDEYRRIKAENPSGIDILHHIENWSPEKQQKAYETIADYERRGLDRLQIMPGQPLFHFLCLVAEKLQESLVFVKLLSLFDEKLSCKIRK